VRLLTRREIDWTNRYPTLATAVAALACRSCLIDGEVGICGEDGVPVFDRLLSLCCSQRCCEGRVQVA
jgi:bifunctional non-homologous end joining protein LigD